jgi:hypothetical protein
MLSEQEYQATKQQLNALLDKTGKQYRTLRGNLRQKLKEHKYAVKYIPFEPLPHIPYFINRTTSEPTLNQLIQAATTSTEFILDTESALIYKEPNRPALIQLHILLPYNLALVIIVEMCHLPRENHKCFQLIQDLFRIIFSAEKTI